MLDYVMGLDYVSYFIIALSICNWHKHIKTLPVSRQAENKCIIIIKLGFIGKKKT